MQAATLALIREGRTEKGDVLGVARIATGADVVLVSDVAYQPTPCEDLSYKSTSPAGEGGFSWRLWTGVAAAGLLIIAGVTARRRIGRRG
jgi:hypothetical protein